MFGFEHNATLNILKTGLDGLERRQLLLSNNVANMNTPGYLTRDLDFKTVMDAQARGLSDPEVMDVSKTDANHMVDDRASSDVWDNAVSTATEAPDLQDQMVKLGQNSLSYATMSQLITHQLRRYRSVIQEGSR
ncbi:MAG: flagellar basal body rod protein FlgB [Proteobacteria bacterium]|nr:flagellar basal body rod protein FlgB [Pseudomonadota bacterium]